MSVCGSASLCCCPAVGSSWSLRGRRSEYWLTIDTAGVSGMETSSGTMAKVRERRLAFVWGHGCAKVERKQHEWSLSEEGKSLEHFPCTTAEEAVRPVITILMYVTVSHGPEPFVLLSPPPLSTEKRSEATWLMSDMLFHKLLAQGQEWTFNL